MVVHLEIIDHRSTGLTWDIVAICKVSNHVYFKFGAPSKKGGREKRKEGGREEEREEGREERGVRQGRERDSI